MQGHPCIGTMLASVRSVPVHDNVDCAVGVHRGAARHVCHGQRGAQLPSRYMGLLLAPLQLSADWSFACIAPVEALSDLRNLATAALYAWLLWVLLSGRPWQARRLMCFSRMLWLWHMSRETL